MADLSIDHYKFFKANFEREELAIQLGRILRSGLSFAKLWTIICKLITHPVPVEEFACLSKSVTFWSALAIDALEKWYSFDWLRVSIAQRSRAVPKEFPQSIRYRLEKLYEAARHGKIYAMKDILSDCLLLVPNKQVAEIEKKLNKKCIISPGDAMTLFTLYFPEAVLCHSTPEYKLMGICYCPSKDKPERMLGEGFSEQDDTWINSIFQ